MDIGFHRRKKEAALFISSPLRGEGWERVTDYGGEGK
jgi:hypothetical protein